MIGTAAAVVVGALTPAGEPTDVVAPTLPSDPTSSRAATTASSGGGSPSASAAGQPTAPTALGEPTSAAASSPPAASTVTSEVPPSVQPTPIRPAAPVTIAAVGDMVCDPDGAPDDDGDGTGPFQCRQQAVSDLVVSRRPAAFLALGDNQYAEGTLQAYETAYGRSYGRLLSITRPVPGNHEYESSGAAGYFAYFGARAGLPGRGYYSYDLGGWHLIALNSNCASISCRQGDPQERWLRADLAAHPARCTLAYYHYPRWSSGEHGDMVEVAPLLQDLYDGGADVVLNGHDHDYERFVPRTPAGVADPARGVREFVVGTGGRSIRAATGGEGTEAISSDSFGALFLELGPDSYAWRFVAVNGSGFTDSGRAACH